MTTRIGIIREAIKAEGGSEHIVHYCDGPNSGSSFRDTKQKRLNETIYKVEKCTDGLTVEARKRVVEALRAHPDVKTAYLSRRYLKVEGHLKIVFAN